MSILKGWKVFYIFIRTKSRTLAGRIRIHKTHTPTEPRNAWTHMHPQSDIVIKKKSRRLLTCNGLFYSYTDFALQVSQ
jgi:hypothetical protein